MRLYRHKLTNLVILFIILAPLNAYAVDVTTWTDRSPGGNRLYGAAYGGGMFVAVGTSGKIWSSPDGIAWTNRSPGGNSLRGAAYGGGLFVAVGDSGQIWSSPDGIAWTDRVVGGNDLWSVAYGGGTFVAVGSNGQIWSSPDGIAWTDRVVGGSALLGVAYGGGMFVAVGNSAQIWSSPDGIVWTNRSPGGTILYGAAYGGGTFVAVGGSGQIWSSPDGIAWTDRVVGGNHLYGAAYGGGLFVAVGNNGQIWSSPDGATWTNQGTWGSNDLRGAAYASDTFVAVGGSGQIWQAGAVTASSGSTTSHTLVVYKTGAPPAGMGYVYSDPAGIACPGACSATFADGTEVSLYTKNINGMEFFRYEGACNGVWRGDPCVLTMDDYKEVPVRFYPPQPWLTWLKLDPITGIGEPVSFGDNSVEFTSDMLQDGCATTTIILHNNADRPLNVGMIGGADPLETPFAITDDTCSDTTLSFRSDCTMKIKYCPADDGQYTDTFDVPTSDPNFPTQTVEVTGGN